MTDTIDGDDDIIVLRRRSSESQDHHPGQPVMFPSAGGSGPIAATAMIGRMLAKHI